MKKSLIALAALAATSTAFAQSSVTLFGVADAAISHSSATGAGSVTQLREGALSSSRLGFRGLEDLGGGMSASFWLEAGFNIDSGKGYNTSDNNTQVGDRILFNSAAPANTPPSTTYAPQGTVGPRQGLTFNRRSTVSLSGAFGEVRLGRDYVPTFWNMVLFDPFGNLGVGSAANTILGFLNPRANGAFPPGAAAPQVRSSNSVGYFLPKLAGIGVYGQVMYAFAEQPNKCTQPLLNSAGGPTALCYGAVGDGRYMGGRIGYAQGPFDVAASYGVAKYGSVTAAAFTGTNFGGAVQGNTAYNGDYKQWNLGGSYDFGVAKAMAEFGDQKVDAVATTGAAEKKLRHWLVGGLVPVGAGTIRASYQYGKRHDSAGVGDNDGAKVSQWSIGYVHNLSKRTAVYATYAHQSATAYLIPVNAGVLGGLASMGTPAVGARVSASGYDFGLRHSF